MIDSEIKFIASFWLMIFFALLIGKFTFNRWQEKMAKRYLMYLRHERLKRERTEKVHYEEKI